MKIVIIGCNGQLGKCLQDKFINLDEQVIFISRNELDISNIEDVNSKLVKEKPNFIVNAAAYTNVDQAEDDFDSAEEVNHAAVKNLSIIAGKIEAVLIHISTDYVFDGSSKEPYTETCLTNPVTKYGLSKFNGECRILESGCKAIIIRTSWVYSEYGNNFLKTMLQLAESRDVLSIVHDQIGRPTYAQDLASIIVKIIKFIKINDGFNNWGIYNYCGNHSCSWFEFAELIFNCAKNKNLKIPNKIIPVSSEAFLTKALRPKFSVLSNKKIERIFCVKASDLKSGIQSAIINH